MKYDILEPFREYLKENLSPNTAKTYYAAVVKLFKDSQFDSLGQIDKEWIAQEAAKRFTTRNEYSAVKNGLKWLKKYNPDLNIPTEKEFCATSIKKRNFSRKPKKVIYLKPTQRKINQISNDRLRYAYRLALASGLRVSELADLEADDFSFKEGKIFVRVKKGKGGHGGLVECQEDSYLYERLPDFLQNCSEGKVFYTESYMRKKADELGIECHDLRRIFAITTREDLKKDMPVAMANEVVQQRLRHARFSTTKRYLFNRKLKFEYEESGEESLEKRKLDIDINEQKNEVYSELSEIEHISNIDTQKFECISEQIMTDEVVLTPNQRVHIIERRGQEFFDKYYPLLNEFLTDPDYIFKDDAPNTALVVKRIKDENKYINIVLRLVIPTDEVGYKNSIITMIGTNEKRFLRFLRNHIPVYKKG